MHFGRQPDAERSLFRAVYVMYQIEAEVPDEMAARRIRVRPSNRVAVIYQMLKESVQHAQKWEIQERFDQVSGRIQVSG